MKYEDFEITVGLEIHAELKTQTKLFCGCKNAFGAEPNTNICPVCTGMPGALPVPNKRAVEIGIKAGLSFDCEISKLSIFERKNYFYPDLSKGYQITQMDSSIAKNGKLKLDSGKIIRINRIQVEEDAGKLIHISKAIGTLIDYNRGGTPLIEMVTEPDFSSAEESVEFLKKVREILMFENIADCKMEAGGMRCDVNVSVRPRGAKKYGVRTEMKNLNSFKSVQRAIEFEADRHINAILQGEKLLQETRRWDDNKGKSFALRAKEDVQDYRYFPDPDILEIIVEEKDIQKVKSEMVELPQTRREKYQKEFGLPKYDSEILTLNKYISDYFENCLQFYCNPKKISNWIMVDLLKLINLNDGEKFPISEEFFTKIVKMVEEKQINKTLGLQLLEKVIQTREDPLILVKKLGMLTSISDDDILRLFNKLVQEMPQVLVDYKQKPEKVILFIVGFVMKNTKGKANTERVRQLAENFFK